MFNYTASGTDNSAPIETDIITLGQGDRGIIEFTPQNTGMHMFHAHINEIADLGWMSMSHVYDKAGRLDQCRHLLNYQALSICNRKQQSKI
jgi:hypothetical protein